MSFLTPKLLFNAGVLLAIIVLGLFIRSAIIDYGDTRFEDGEKAERAVWTAAVKKRDGEIAKVRDELTKTEKALRDAQDDHADALTAAKENALADLSARDQTILKLKGELNARPILNTPSARELVPAGRLSVHARADQALAENRRRYRDAAGQRETNAAASPALQIRESALVADGGLSLGAAEQRAAVLAVALAATEGRYEALWNWAQSQYRADLKLWEAEQARRADVAARVIPD